MAIGYEITVSGQYRSDDGATKGNKRYSNEVFFLPEIVRYRDPGGRDKADKMVQGVKVTSTVPRIIQANALNVAPYIIRKFHLPFRLAEKYDDFSSIRTIHILTKKRVRLDDKAVRDVLSIPIDDMNESELAQYHALNDLNTHLSGYGSLAERKMAVKQEAVEKKRLLRQNNPARTTNEQMSEPAGLIGGPPLDDPVDGEMVDDDNDLSGLLSMTKV